MSFRGIADKVEGARLNYDPNREFSQDDYLNELGLFEQNVKSNIDTSTLGQSQKANLTDQLDKTMKELRDKKKEPR